MIPRSGTRNSPVVSRSITVLPNHGAKELTIVAAFTLQGGIFMAGAIFSSVIDLHNGTQVPKTVGVLLVRLLANFERLQMSTT
jgi:hypothetical protein